MQSHLKIAQANGKLVGGSKLSEHISGLNICPALDNGHDHIHHVLSRDRICWHLSQPGNHIAIQGSACLGLAFRFTRTGNVASVRGFSVFDVLRQIELDQVLHSKRLLNRRHPRLFLFLRLLFLLLPLLLSGLGSRTTALAANLLELLEFQSRFGQGGVSGKWPIFTWTSFEVTGLV